MLTFVIEFIGFQLVTIVLAIIQPMVPVLFACFGIIDQKNPGKTGEWMLKYKNKIYVILIMVLIFSVILFYDHKNYIKTATEKSYNPEFITIDEDIINSIKGVHWGEDDSAYVAQDKFGLGVKALKEKEISEAKGCFNAAIAKCDKSGNRELNKLKAASYNNLLVTEYLDLNYKKLKDTKLNTMDKQMKKALSFDATNEKIIKNQDYLHLHRALYKVLGK